jgi:hypothetical protein
MTKYELIKFLEEHGDYTFSLNFYENELEIKLKDFIEIIKIIVKKDIKKCLK